MKNINSTLSPRIDLAEEVMVKIDSEPTEQSELAIQSLAQEKFKSSDKYNTEEVFMALRKIFHDKCYLCEFGLYKTSR